jgi:hypothetical protein
MEYTKHDIDLPNTFDPSYYNNSLLLYHNQQQQLLHHKLYYHTADLQHKDHSSNIANYANDLVYDAASYYAINSSAPADDIANIHHHNRIIDPSFIIQQRPILNAPIEDHQLDLRQQAALVADYNYIHNYGDAAHASSCNISGAATCTSTSDQRLQQHLVDPKMLLMLHNDLSIQAGSDHHGIEGT